MGQFVHHHRRRHHHQPCLAIMCHSLTFLFPSSSDFPSSGSVLVTPPWLGHPRGPCFGAWIKQMRPARGSRRGAGARRGGKQLRAERMALAQRMVQKDVGHTTSSLRRGGGGKAEEGARGPAARTRHTLAPALCPPQRRAPLPPTSCFWDSVLHGFCKVCLRFRASWRRGKTAAPSWHRRGATAPPPPENFSPRPPPAPVSHQNLSAAGNRGWTGRTGAEI